MERVISNEIRLTPLQRSDAQAFLAAVEFSRENLSHYMPWEKHVIDCNSAEAYIDSRIRSGVPGAAWFSIQFNGQFSGVFAIKSIDPVSRVSELGYWLADNARGQRVVDQVLQTMVPALAREQGVRVFEFHCLESNHASINIVKRLGATLRRKVEHDLALPDCHDLLCIYALDAEPSQNNKKAR